MTTDRIKLDDHIVIDIDLSVNEQRVAMMTTRPGGAPVPGTLSLRRQDARRLGVKLIQYVGRMEEAEDSKRRRRRQGRGGR